MATTCNFREGIFFPLEQFAVSAHPENLCHLFVLLFAAAMLLVL